MSNKTGLKRLNMPSENWVGMTVPVTKKIVVQDVFVLHMLPERTKITFTTFRAAYKEFVKRAKRDHGSVALWRGPVWSRLYMSDRYPPALQEPYINADV